MLVVTIMLVVFLASVIIINYSLTKQDNTTVLNKIISRNLRAIPGVQNANTGFGGQNSGLDNGSAQENAGEVAVPGGGGPWQSMRAMEGRVQEAQESEPLGLMLSEPMVRRI